MKIIKKEVSKSNYTEGRMGNKIEAIVVHWIVGTLETADIVFADGRRRVSAHYGVGGSEIHQWVDNGSTAWHCGDWLWNLKSLGLEHEGGPELNISDETYETSAKLIKELCTKHNIPIDKEHILPHNNFVETQCPGTLDIDRLITLALGDGNRQDRIEALEDEIVEITRQRNKKDRKLETCRDERAENKSDFKEHLEEIQETLSKSQNLNISFESELLKRTEERDNAVSEGQVLQEKANSLNNALDALGGKLTEERESYAILEGNYAILKDIGQKELCSINRWKVFFSIFKRRCNKS